jgi:hypothetical protein
MDRKDEDALVIEVKKLNTVLSKLMRRQNLRYSFLAGLMAGLGSILGSTLVIALLLYLLSQADFIPLIGSWLADLAQQTSNSLPQK